jgi:N-acetylneuraminic acid mutarotase
VDYTKILVMQKAIFIFCFFTIAFSSCIPRKCCEDQFSWKKGKPANHEFQSNLAFSEGNKVYTVGGPNNGAFESYDIKTKKWTTLPSIPVPVSYASGVLSDHHIYVFGGIDSSLNYTDLIQTFDLIQNRWTSSGKLEHATCRSAAVVVDGKIYLIGGMTGKDDNHAVNSSKIEIYNPVSGHWKTKKDMPTSRHGHSVVSVNNKIIVAGGFTAAGETELVEEYDSVKDEWARKADLPYPNGFFGLIAMGDKIYALGGRLYDDLAPVIKYDINADQWTQVSTMPEFRNRFGVAVIGKYVYLIGGENAPQTMLVGKRG